MADKKEAAEAASNCAECKKSISRRKRYYRDGAYYCNKNCYKKKIEKINAEKAEKAAEELAKKPKAIPVAVEQPVKKPVEKVVEVPAAVEQPAEVLTVEPQEETKEAK